MRSAAVKSATCPTMSVKELAQSRARNRTWCEKHRAVKRKQAWLLGAPPYGTHLPGGGVTLHVTPSPRWPMELRNTRALHGMVTALTGIPHHPTVPQFALVPWPCPFGWGIYSHHAEAMERIAGGRHSCVLFDEQVTVQCGPLVRVRAPVIRKRGKRRLRVDAITPVLVRHGGKDNRSTYTAPTADNLRGTLAAWLPRRVGLELDGDDVRLELIDRATQPATVLTGGKFGATRGWEGHVIVETNAVGHWLLEVASRIGFGGRVALGFGRIRVSTCD